MANRLLVATRKGLFDLQRDTSGEWGIVNRSFLGDPVSMMLRDAHDRTLYAALALGHFGVKLHRSDDEGRSWQEISTPSYEGVPADGEDKEAPSLKMIWSLEAGAPGVLWAGTIPGGLFCSADRGDSWQLVDSLWNDPSRQQWFGGGYDEPGIHSICVDPRDPKHMTIAVSCGGVWRSEDQGQSWGLMGNGMRAEYMPPEQSENPATQDPHRLVQCRAEPDHFWVQHHNGIFYSKDSCRSWQEIAATPSSFGFAVAVHPQNPAVAWFVPGIKDEKRYPVDGKLIVTQTSDGGKTFVALDTGLPQVESYDLVYRHAFDIDADGDSLAMASTTGNLWLSEDGGCSWRAISNYLPPVYAVRFV